MAPIPLPEYTPSAIKALKIYEIFNKAVAKVPVIQAVLSDTDHEIALTALGITVGQRLAEYAKDEAHLLDIMQAFFTAVRTSSADHLVAKMEGRT